MIQLDYRDARPIYLQIADRLREQITLGVLQSDDRLPSVRELATDLSINPNTIQRSYRQLEMDGWIATVPGKGCFVRGVPHSAREQQTMKLEEFDRYVASLLSQGFTPEMLAERILKGGNPSCLK